MSAIGCVDGHVIGNVGGSGCLFVIEDRHRSSKINAAGDLLSCMEFAKILATSCYDYRNASSLIGINLPWAHDGRIKIVISCKVYPIRLAMEPTYLYS